jgi:23S rRNA pseudouridine1911/1915/1917 synthase
MNTNDYIDEVEITEEIPVILQRKVVIPAKWRGERLDKALAANLAEYSRK